MYSGVQNISKCVYVVMYVCEYIGDLLTHAVNMMHVSVMTLPLFNHIVWFCGFYNIGCNV